MKKAQDGKAARQNSIYSATSKHATNLRRNPTVHFQIGLILALLTSIFFIEMRMPDKAVHVVDHHRPIEEVFTIDQVQVEKKIVEKPKFIKKEPLEKPKFLEKDPQTTDEDILEEDLIDTTDKVDEPMVDPKDVIFDNSIGKPEPEPTVFSLVEQVPLFPGCEGLSNNDERRDCMSNKISKFVSKKFRTNKAADLGLEGINRIFVTFKINKEGKVVEVNARAAHKSLEEEAKRVTSLLPDMTAGKQGGKNVDVLFSLPISFQIQD